MSISKLDPAHIRVLDLLVRRYPDGIQSSYREVDGLVQEYYSDDEIDFEFLCHKTFWDYDILKHLLHEIRRFHCVKTTAASINIWRRRKR